MLALKAYQQDALDALARYFQTFHQAETMRQSGFPLAGDGTAAAYAFEVLTRELLGQAVPYNDVGKRQSLDELRGLPYVCLRIPTGGGKTLVGAHAVGVARREAVQTDHAVILWLVPSDTIRSQTLAAFRNPKHPYRLALDEATGGAVHVCDVAEALYLGSAAYDTSTVVIVDTVQKFKTTDATGRKVYDDDGALMSHFTPERVAATPGLQPVGDGVERPAYSLANVLRMRRPVVVMDEAHNNRTSLAFDTLARLRPACVIELTATPKLDGKDASNVLYRVSALALKAEGMIKLPLTLTVSPDWKTTLADAIGKRKALENDAKAEREQHGTPYLRPILLVQAQPKNAERETVTVDVVEQYLLEEAELSKATVAVHAYDRRDLDGVDLSSPSCPIRVVVTVDALREGWDAPFVYVLASLGNVAAATAVEQLVGRVLRMPNATPRPTQSLNEAYVFAASDRFSETLRGLQDALVQQGGFDRLDVLDLVRAANARQAEDRPADPLPLFAGVAGTGQGVELALPVKLNAAALSPALQHKVTYDAVRGTLEVREPLTVAEVTALVAAVPEAQRLDVAAVLAELPTAREAPALRGVRFDVPVLALRQGSLFERLTVSDVTENVEWRLRDAKADLPSFTIPARAHEVGKLDVSETSGRLLTGVVSDGVDFAADLEQQMSLFAQEGSWDEDKLVRWLDANTYHPDVLQQDARAFIRNVLESLQHDRKEAPSLPLLVRLRYRLAVALNERIKLARQDAHAKGLQTLLLPSNDRLAVRPDVVFSFPQEGYAPYDLYRGGHVFAKHFYEHIGGMNGEEVLVAMELDKAPRVDYWVRNVERQRARSYWLVTSSDYFYPDFVAMLTDGRQLAVEHKSSRDWDNPDTKEKRDVGAAWAELSGGRCLFVMTRDKDFSALHRVLAG